MARSADACTLLGMQINAAYLPKVTEAARLAGMAEASQLLQDAGTLIAAMKANSVTTGSRWASSLRPARNGRRW
jgi:hypothetical protein